MRIIEDNLCMYSAKTRMKKKNLLEAGLKTSLPSPSPKEKRLYNCVTYVTSEEETKHSLKSIGRLTTGVNYVGRGSECRMI